MTSKSPDQLTTTTDQGKIELQERELSRVTGGTAKAAAENELREEQLEQVSGGWPIDWGPSVPNPRPTERTNFFINLSGTKVAD
jgi:hypothetical protein